MFEKIAEFTLFYSEQCGFAFKTKSNLYKHCKSRTHILKVEKGIDSSSTDIMAELGDTLREEIDSGLPVSVSALSMPTTMNNSQLRIALAWSFLVVGDEASSIVSA